MEHNTALAPAGTPWGLGATAGFSVVIIACFFIISALVAALFVVIGYYTLPEGHMDQLSLTLEMNGLLLSLSLCATALCCTALIALFVHIRKDTTIRQYLFIQPVNRKTLMLWLGIVVVLVGLSDGVTHLIGRSILPAFMIEAYKTAHVTPLLWFAVIIAAPVFEESFFRGFLFEGIRCSRLGSTGAVLITSLIWMVIHVQYDFFELVQIFILGIILGIARLRTQSLVTTMIMHSFLNLIATTEVAIYLRFILEK